MDEATLEDIFELRLVIEMGLADLLFIRMNRDEIDELEAIAENEVEHKSFLVKNEIAFHGKLYDMTGNATLKRFQIMLLPVFAHVTAHVDKHISGKVNHKDLVQILKKGSKEDFKTAMYEHLKPHFDRLKKG
jgi:DNA-binding FadR family transcriptional regulator